MFSSIIRLMPETLKSYLLRMYFLVVRRQKLASGVRVNFRTQLGKHTAVGLDSQIAGTVIEEASYIGNDCCLSNTEIGRYCSIGSRVRANFGLHPARTFVSTHPAFYSSEKYAGITFTQETLFQAHKYVDDQKCFVVRIGNDVWVGDGVSILDGVVIGDGAVIGTNAVVTKDVEPYSIVGGVPAKIIGYRFSPDQIEFLLDLKWWDKGPDWLQRHAKYFNNIDKLRHMLE